MFAQFARELLALNAKYGLNLTGAPKLNDPDFVYQLVFDPARGARQPKARFAYLFPSPDSALVSVRLKAGLSDAERSDAVALVREAVRMPEWQLEGGGTYVVTGVPVLAGDLTDELAGSTLRLLLVAVAVMALVLALLFRSRFRLLPLAIALGRSRSCSGGSSALGLPLTMASIAVLPILLGLRRRLRDPVPGARPRRARRPRDRDCGARDRRRLPDPPALAGPDGARLRRAADRGRGRGALLALTPAPRC